MQGPSERFDPNLDRVWLLLELPFDQIRRLSGIALNDCCREILLRRKMIVDAGTLDAHVGCNLSKTETVEAALPHSPFSSVHDGGGDVTHWVCSRGYLSIGRASRDEKQRLSVY